MHLSHLSLTYFRNYHSLEIDFEKSLTLLQGQNAQGKTNLLEAIYYLATSKPIHAQLEREVVDWQAANEPIPYCRIAAELIDEDDRERDPLQLEIVLTPRARGNNYNKQIKINGVTKRNIDLVGLMRAVLFLPEDIKLVAGAPGERRHYMDVALCQIDRMYTGSLSRYQKVLTHRNSLLKDLREQGLRAGDSSAETQLGFWDDQLIEHGGYVIARRYEFVQQLQRLAYRRHFELSGHREQLHIQYVPSFNPGYLSAEEYRALKEGVPPEPVSVDVESDISGTLEAMGGQMGRLTLAEAAPEEYVAATAPLDPEEVAEQFRSQFMQRRSRELAAGSTLYGPHRDDLRFLANERDLRTYGSRGQQRSAALSLKLAEVQAMNEATGSLPLLLLDDVMSELDAQRRSTLLAALDGVAQAILTTTDLEDFTPEFRDRAQLFKVHNGTVVPLVDIE